MKARLDKSLGSTPRTLGRHVVVVACIVAVLAAVSSLGAQSAAQDERAIRDARERSNRAIAAHDTAALAAEWTESLHVTTSNSLMMAGRAENTRRFAEQFASRPGIVYRRSPEKVTVYSPWSMAAESGHWTGQWQDKDGTIRVGGSYFAKWQKADGHWRILAEIYVPDHCSGGAYCSTIPAAPK